MACIVWKMPNGEEYNVPENKAHTPLMGAFNTGRVDWKCAGNEPDPALVADMMARNGIQWGSAVKWVTKRLGIKQCSGCKAREMILNHAAEKGWAATIKELKETF